MGHVTLRELTWDSQKLGGFGPASGIDIISGVTELERLDTAKVMLSEISEGLETLFGAGALGQLSDAELLARFLRRDEAAGSEAAFSELLARHAPMVMGVCNRMVADSQGAADAFQAVFLVLVRKASVVRVEDSLGRWLYGVSVRVARRARRRALWREAARESLEGFDRAGGGCAVGGVRASRASRR